MKGKGAVLYAARGEMAPQESFPSSDVGATYHWIGNEEVGVDIMSLDAIEEGKIVMGLKLITSEEGVAKATATYAAAGEGSKVTWVFDQTGLSWT